MVMGAYQTLLAAGKADKVKVFGFDGTNDVMKAVTEDKIATTVIQFPKTMARTAAENADRYIKFAVTPTYHVFAMFAPHQGAQSLRTEVAAPSLTYDRNGKPATLRRLSSSASVNGKQLTVTVTNLHMTQPATVHIQLHGASPTSVDAVTLSASDPHAHNTFAAPDAVAPKAVTVAAKGSTITHDFPPASVTRLSVQLA